LLLSLPLRAERFVFTTIWTAQAQFAGYYVAKEKGFYDELGLDVVIQHPSLNSSPLYRLQHDESNAAMFSLLSAIDLISQGVPLVNIFQDSMNSSNILVSRWGMNPLQMKGKKVAVFNSDPNYLLSILSKQQGMDYQLIPFTSGINVFLSGAVDATMVVSYNEYFQLKTAGQRLKKEQMLYLRDIGYNVPEDGLYVTKDFLKKHREEVLKFAEATRKGWEWAVAHPEEALDIVMITMRQTGTAGNMIAQDWMIKEILRQLADKDTGKRSYRLEPKSVELANRILLESGFLKKEITYHQITQQ
jgi:NitT/TauT family transport system substrate-binding protein